MLNLRSGAAFERLHESGLVQHQTSIKPIGVVVDTRFIVRFIVRKTVRERVF